MERFLQKLSLTLFICATILIAGNAQPVAGFIVDSPVPACNPSTVSFTNTSTGISPLTYQWFFEGDVVPDTSGNPSFIVDSCGSFEVVLLVTDSLGQTDADTQTVSIHCTPIALFNASSLEVCAGDTLFFFDATISSDLISEWLYIFEGDSASTPNAFYVFQNEGIHPVTLKVKTVFGCEDSRTLFITVFPLPQANAGSDQMICAGDTTQLQATGGIVFNWFPAISISDPFIADPLASPFTTQQYTVEVTDSNGCRAKDSVLVIVNPLTPVAIIGVDPDYCINDSLVELHANIPGGTFSGSGVAGNQFDPSALQPGITEIFYAFTDSNGCVSHDTIALTIHALPEIEFTSSANTVCLNGAPILLTVSPAGGTLSGIGISGSTFDPQLAGSPGDYTLYYSVTDVSGCSNSDSLIIGVVPLPNVVANNDTVICSAGFIQLTASGGSHYQWEPSALVTNDTIPNPLAFISSTTTFTVAGTNDQGCSDTDTVTISIFSAALVNAGSDTSICLGDTLMLNASGGSQYEWSPADGLSETSIPNPLAFPLQTTVYTVSITAGTCTGIDSLTITVNELPVVTASIDTAVCRGDTLQLSATGAAVIFSWQPASFLSDDSIANPLAFPDSSITFFVKGTDLFGCMGSDSVIITILELPVIIASDDTSVCSGDTVILNATGAISYSWNPVGGLSDPSIPNPLAFPSLNTVYVVTGTDLNGCSNQDSVFISLLNSNSLDAGNDTSICLGDTIMLHATGGDNYLWSPADFLGNPQSPTPLAFPDTTITYLLTAFAGVCVETDTLTIIVNGLSVVNAGEDTFICMGNSVQLMANGAVNYQWSPANSLSDSTIADPIASPSSTTFYNVVGTDVNGCMDSDQVLITVYALPVVQIFADSAMCLGDTIPMFATGGIFYHWSPSAGLNYPDNYATEVFASSTTTYTVTVTDANQCTSSGSATIVVNPLPQINATTDTLVCSGSSIQLNAEGGAFYSWQPGTGLSDQAVSDPVAFVTSSISYVVVVTDDNGCQNRDTIFIDVASPLNAYAFGDTIICPGGIAELSAGGGVSFEWLPMEGLNNPVFANPIATPSTSTTYTVYVSDDICYADTFTIDVLVQSAPFINAGPDANVISGTIHQFNVNASEGAYHWTPPAGLSCTDCLNPQATPGQTTTYTVSVTDSIGCIASDDITLTVSCGEDVVFVPNTFTPDGNGLNDVLYVRSFGIQQLSYFRVYDRWGKIIFESNNLDEGWNGTYKDQPMQPGVFLYEWQVTCSNSEVVRKQGNVTLLR